MQRFFILQDGRDFCYEYIHLYIMNFFRGISVSICIDGMNYINSISLFSSVSCLQFCYMDEQFDSIFCVWYSYIHSVQYLFRSDSEFHNAGVSHLKGGRLLLCSVSSNIEARWYNRMFLTFCEWYHGRLNNRLYY